MLILIVLFILSLFIPPFWIAFFIYLIWRIYTAKYRRQAIMRYEISKLISSDETDTFLSHISYEAAQQYALSCGAESDPYYPDNMSFQMKTPKVTYHVFISSMPDGSTFLCVEDINDPNSAHGKARNFLNEKYGINLDQTN